MPFIDSAEMAIQALPESDSTRIVLEYLLEHGRGRGNARPWPDIEAHLLEHGIQMDQKKFQQTILKKTRENEIFIGSNDHNPKGYFLIEDRIDAELAREFYTRRIAAQQANLDHLDQLIQQQQWN